MKVIGISDLHGNLINIPKCDIVCIAGDIIPLNIQKDYTESNKWWRTKFIEWCNSINCGKIFVVPGNHDFYLEYLYKDKNKYQEFINQIYTLTLGKVEILIDILTEYKGLKIYGCPWIAPIDFQHRKWAFEEYNYNSDNVYSKIPECDILITHDSPIENELLNIESWYKCKYHLYGHWHECKGNISANKYNCSIIDNMYNLKKNYTLVQINIDMEKTKFELLQEFTEKVKDIFEPLLDTITGPERDDYLAEVDSLLLSYLDNPKDTEDSIAWNESEMINDLEYNNEIDIEDEYK